MNTHANVQKRVVIIRVYFGFPFIGFMLLSFCPYIGFMLLPFCPYTGIYIYTTTLSII